MNKEDKIREGQVLLDKRENYESLALPMVTETSQRVKELIKALYHGNHIDEITLIIIKLKLIIIKLKF